MARKKDITIEMVQPVHREATEHLDIPTTITKLSVDYGREDINNIASKVNELIDYINTHA